MLLYTLKLHSALLHLLLLESGIGQMQLTIVLSNLLMLKVITATYHWKKKES